MHACHGNYLRFSFKTLNHSLTYFNPLLIPTSLGLTYKENVENGGNKIMKLLGSFLALFLVHCASTAPLTTELQARSNDKIKVEKASKAFQLESRKFKPIQYQIFDSAGDLAKNKIVARYRDKGNNVDFTLKLRFDYDEKMLKLLSQCFIGQKIEINRYSDQPKAIVEVSFQQSYKKDDMGMIASQSLTEFQILEKFQSLQEYIDEEIEALKSEHPEFYENLSDLDATTLKNFAIVSQKINVILESNVSEWKQTSAYQRDRWTIGPWQRNAKGKIYPEVVVEVTHNTNPTMEISTRLDGDVTDKSFFQDLRLFGLSI